MAINVLIAEDENLIRHLYITALRKYEDVSVIGQASNGEEAIEMLQTNRPDVLLLDLIMPKVSGIEVLRYIQEASLRINTIVISLRDEFEVIQEVIESGALGFLCKTTDWDELYNAIKTASTGQFVYSEKTKAVLLEMARDHKHKSSANALKFDERELSIIRYLNDGFGSAEIADKLYCSRATIDRIRQKLFHQVGAHNTAGLIAFALRNKLIEVSSV